MNRLPINALGVVISLLTTALLLAPSSQAEQITSGIGNGADAYIELGADSGDSFGSDTELRVRSHPDFPPDTSDTGKFVRKTYLRFDLSTVTVTPRTGEADDVVLSLAWKQSFSGGDDPTYGGLPWTINLYGLNDGTTGDNSPSSGGWAEGTINGSNSPANDLNNDGDDRGTPTKGLTSDATAVLASVTLSSAASTNDTLTFSSAELTEFIRADANELVTLILVAENDSQGNDSIAVFWSHEGSGMAPTLAINDGSPPPPPPPEPGPEEALAQLDLLYEGYFAWFGSMYHRQSGGSYYSFAAREAPHQYPPHIESTSKFNRVIEWSEQIPFVPSGMRDNIVSWTKGNQVGDPGSADYGYFLANGYSFDDKEKSRSLGFSTGILSNYDATPDYPLPGEAGTLPSHLNSAAAFLSWLKSRNWTRTWTSGSDLLTQGGYIRQLTDETLRQEILDVTWDYMANVQQNPNGLWGDLTTGDNRNPYIALNGAHKIVAFYEGFNQPVPLAENLMDTCRDEVATTVPTNLLYIYNSSEMAYNLTKLGATISEQEAADFVEKQADYLNNFFNPDGGIKGSGSAYFEPNTNNGSNTDVGGLALKARDRLHDLVYGDHEPLPNASDPRLYGMSGLNSDVLVKYEFVEKSLEATTLNGSGITASQFSASGTMNSNGPDGDGFEQETDPSGGSTGDFEIAHTAFDDTSSYYEFTMTPGARLIDLYFLALNTRHGGTGIEDVVVTYRVGDSGGFTEAGRTTISGSDVGFVTRDIPLLIFGDLSHLDTTVTFRIYGENFNSNGRTFQLDFVELYGVERAISFSQWTTSQELTGDDARPEATPLNDGVSNLNRYAFNLPASSPARYILEPGMGVSGLPHLDLDRTEVETNFRFEFLRRRHSGITYTPKIRTTLEPGTWTPVNGPAQVEFIDSDWERVIYHAPFNPLTSSSIFGQVETSQ